MANGGGNPPPAPPPDSGGEFLLSLLHRRPYQPPSNPEPPHHHQQQHQSFPVDPAISAVGPTVNHFPQPYNGSLTPSPSPSPSPWPLAYSPPNLLGVSQFLPLNQFDGNNNNNNQRVLGFNGPIQNQNQPPQLDNRKLVFGSFSGDPTQSLRNVNLHSDPHSSSEPNLFNLQSHEQRGGGGFSGRGSYGAIGNYSSNGGSGRGLKSSAPPGFLSNFQRSHHVELSGEEERLRRLSIQSERFSRGQQMDHPGPVMGTKSLHSVSGADAVDSFSLLKKESAGGGGEFKGKREGDGEYDEIEDFGEDIVESLLLDDEIEDKDNAKDEKKSSRLPREKVCFFMV